MTLIACSFLNDFPIILGDVLVSTKQVEPHFQLPVRPEFLVSDLITDFGEDRPFEFVQKLYVISPTTAIAFAGAVWEAKNFLHDFKIRNSIFDGRLSDENIRQFLRQYNQSEFKESSGIILNITPQENGMIWINHFLLSNWGQVKSLNLDTVAIAGSGAEYFSKHVNVFELFLGGGGKESQSMKFIKTVCTIAQLLLIERYNLSTIKELWGAAFELISFTEHGFEKLDNIAYVLVKQKYLEDDSALPGGEVMIIHQKYYGDVLVLASIPIFSYYHFQEGDEYFFSSDEHNLTFFPIMPIEQFGLHKQFDLIICSHDMHSSAVAISYLLELDNGYSIHPTYFDLDGSIDFKLSFNSRRLTIQMNQETYHKILGMHKQSIEQMS